MALSLYIFVQNDETAPAWGDEGYVTTVPQEHINWETCHCRLKEQQGTLHCAPPCLPSAQSSGHGMHALH